MKNFFKIMSLVLIVTMLSCVTTFATIDEKYADELYELGLFKGTDKGYELEKTLTREESATVLVRLLGEEKNVIKNEYNGFFEDVEKERWSFNYIMYCYENDITKGTGNNMFSPASEVTAEEFVTLMLRLLGYTGVEPENAFEMAVVNNLFTSQYARELKKSDLFTRNDMTYIVYRSLKTKMSNGTLLSQDLADKKVITQKQADEFDVYKNATNMEELMKDLLD